MTAMFCGQENGRCDTLSQEDKLSRSVENIKEYYTVGLLEDLQRTVKLFESIFPTFFAGATDLLSTITEKNVMADNNLYIEPNEKTTSLLIKHLNTDIYLYDRVKDIYYYTLRTCLEPRD